MNSDDDKRAVPDMPTGVLLLRLNAACALIGMTTVVVVVVASLFPEAPDAGIAGITALMVLLPVGLFGLLHGVPAWSPRKRWAYYWSMVHLLFGVISCWWTLPTLLALAAFVRPATRAWYYGEDLEADAPKGVLGRRGGAAFIVVYWAICCTILTFTAVSAAKGPSEQLVVDGVEQMIVRQEHTTNVPVGEPVDLYAQTIDGEPWQLSMQQAPLTLLFWATWCPDCDREMPQAASIDGPRFAVATDCFTDEGDNREVVREKMKAAGLDWPIICAYEGGLVEIIDEIPSLLILDEQHRVRFWQIGTTDAFYARDILDGLTQREK